MQRAVATTTTRLKVIVFFFFKSGRGAPIREKDREPAKNHVPPRVRRNTLLHQRHSNDALCRTN